jgi:hypothetical protein
MMSATLTPADGRSYGGRKAVLEDWIGGKDFVLSTMVRDSRCSIRDAQMLRDLGYTHLTFRNPSGHILTNVPLGEAKA